MKKTPAIHSLIMLWTLSTLLSSAAFALSPEQETLILSRRLKPIPDETWKQLAGAHLSERYTIEKNDTLWDVSKRLFGDPTYWPKIWALNNDSITNPHRIRPGRSIAFLPGSGTSLPTVAINDSGPADAAAPPDARAAEPGASPLGSPLVPAENDQVRSSSAAPRRSNEWKNLPKQTWETVTIQLPPQVDQYGFEKSPRVHKEALNGYELEKFAETKQIDPVGKVLGSNAESDTISTSDLIFVRADAGVFQKGQRYTIVESPARVSSDGRKAWVYPVLGEARIERIEGSRTIARVTRGSGQFDRGAFLIPLVPHVPNLQPIPGPAGVEGKLAMDRYFSTYGTVQHATSFVNRGTKDGVRPGMVFRAYLHRDPVTERKVMSGNVVSYADFLVVHVSENFSTLVGYNTERVVEEDADVVILTDVSSLLKGKHDNSQDIETSTPPAPEPSQEPEASPAPAPSPEASPAAPEPVPSPQSSDAVPPPDVPAPEATPAAPGDELEKLEGNDTLGEDEKKELKQLEDWKGNAAPTPAPGAPETAPPPGEVPPPAEAAPPPEVPPPASEELAPPPPEELPPAPGAPEGFEPPKPAPTATTPPTPDDF